MSVRTIVKSIQDIMRQDVGVDGDAQRISQLCWMFFLKIIDDQDQELELTKDDYRSPIPKKYQWRTWAADPEGSTGEELLAFVNNELFPALKNLPTSPKPGDRRRVVKDVFEDAYNYMKSGQLMRQVVNKISAVDFNNLAERQHFGDIYEQILNDLQSAGNAGEYYTPRAVTAFMADRIDPKPGEILLDPACGTGGFLTCAINHLRKRYVKRPEDEVKMQAALRAVEKKQLPHMLCVTNMLLHGIEDPSFVRHDNTLARPYISYTQSDRVDIVLTNPPFGGREEDGIESNFPVHFRTKETADLFLALIIRLLKAGGRAAVVLPDGTLFGEGVKTRLKEHLLEECNLHTIVRLPNSVFKPYASIGTNLLFFEKGGPTKDIWFWEHRVPEGQKAYSMTKPIRFEQLLKRIAAEKTRLVKAGKIRKENPLPPVEEGESSFDLPRSWCWTRLGVVASYIQRGKSPKYAASDGSPVVSQKCVQWRGLDLTVAKHVTRESLADYEEVRFLRDGDLLWNSTGTGTIGRVIRLVDPPEQLVCDGHVTVVRCIDVDPEYVRTWLQSDHVYALIEDRAAGSTNQVELTAQMAVNEVVPIPPLAEQHRIVATVDELMALCDRLEAARAERELKRDRLTAASLARLNESDPDPATFVDHANFALNNLPAITTRPDQIRQLRQTILNLAVRGRLVPPGPE